MKIVVTGGAGMIGSNLCYRLLKDGHSVIAIDNLWRGSKENLQDLCDGFSEKLTFINADLSSMGDWMECLRGADCVYHLADIVAGIGYVFQNENYIFRKNLIINAVVASACDIMNVKRYVYVGTACSFPLELQTGVDAVPLVEEDQFPAHPESAYGWSKLMGELDAGYMSKYSGIDTVTLVFHNVYGTPCDYKSPRSQVIPAIAYRALQAMRGSKTLSVWGDGSQGRAFVHVDDVVDALMLSLTRGHNVGAMQIGPSECISIRYVAESLVRLIDPEIQIVFDTSMPTGDKGRCANYAKAREHLGWSPKTPFVAGLERLVEYIESKESWSAM